MAEDKSTSFNEAGAIQLRKSLEKITGSANVACFNEAGAIQLRKSIGPE